MANWGTMPGHFPDFNNLIHSNVEMLRKMQHLLRDYAQAQKEHSLKLQIINDKHQPAFDKIMINSTVPDLPNLIFKTIANLFQTIRRESDNRSAMEDTIRTEINLSFNCIALFNQQKEELCQTYNTRLSSLKKDQKNVMRLQHNFKSASKKISQKATDSLSDQISQAFSPNARKSSDLRRLSIASLAKEDYQNVLKEFNNKQNEVYRETINSLCKKQQQIYEQQCTFCLTTSDKVTEMAKRAMSLRKLDDKPISTKILQSCIRYSDYFSDPERKKPVPSDLRFSDSSEPGNINDTDFDNVTDYDSDGLDSVVHSSISNLERTISEKAIVTKIEESRNVEDVFDDVYMTPPALVDHEMLFDFAGDDLYEQALSCKKGERLAKLVDNENEYWEPNSGWTKVQNMIGRVGFVPTSYLRKITDKCN